MIVWVGLLLATNQKFFFFTPPTSRCCVLAFHRIQTLLASSCFHAPRKRRFPLRATTADAEVLVKAGFYRWPIFWPFICAESVSMSSRRLHEVGGHAGGSRRSRTGSEGKTAAQVVALGWAEAAVPIRKGKIESEKLPRAGIEPATLRSSVSRSSS